MCYLQVKKHLPGHSYRVYAVDDWRTACTVVFTGVCKCVLLSQVSKGRF